MIAFLTIVSFYYWYIDFIHNKKTDKKTKKTKHDKKSIIVVSFCLAHHVMNQCITHKKKCKMCIILKLVMNETYDKDTNSKPNININVSKLFQDKKYNDIRLCLNQFVQIVRNCYEKKTTHVTSQGWFNREHENILSIISKLTKSYNLLLNTIKIDSNKCAIKLPLINVDNLMNQIVKFRNENSNTAKFNTKIID